MRTLLLLMLSLLATAAHAQVGIPITPGEPARGPAVMEPLGSGVGVPVSPETVPTPMVPLTPPQAPASRVSQGPSPSSSFSPTQTDGEPPLQFAPSALPQMNDPPRPDLYRPDLR